jgi:hypothetical protein
VTGTIKWPLWPLYGSNLSFRRDIRLKCRFSRFSLRDGKREAGMLGLPKILPAGSELLLLPSGFLWR